MKLWAKIISAAVPSFILLALLLLLYRRRCRRQQLLINPQSNLHFSQPAVKSNIKSNNSSRNSLRFHHLDSQLPSPETTFRWENHPRLIAVAVENGWQSFVFSKSIPRSPSSSQLWALCVPCDAGTQPKLPEISWEIPAGSSELMQAVKLNPPLKKTADEPSFSWVRTGLPLPGPVLGGGSFPQEAYFEITIVFLKQPIARKSVKDRESDRAKLIRENSIGLRSVSSNSNFALEERMSAGIGAIALGLTSSTTLPIKSMPGTYHGSIGFHSNGSLFLDERKLVFESEKAEWAAMNRVIGCGFAPSKNKVFFTVDSQIAHVIRCNSEVYSNPLFPFLAANVETKLIVNLGQAPFKYTPANLARTTNPCFFRSITGEEGGELRIGSVMNSQELFSVSRIETESIGYGGRRKNQSSRSSEDVLDGESDLFEIVLQR